MAYHLDVPLGMVLVGVLLLLLIGAIVVVMVRSGRPDPKMDLMLSLMGGFPKEDHNGNPDQEGSEVRSPTKPFSKTAWRLEDRA